MSSSILLSITAKYSNDRINGSKVSRDCFVTTDSMVQNKGGITITPVLPKGNLIAYSKGDILIGNIRPYLKKIWYANRDGGCSPDVLVIQAKSSIDSKFLYYCLFRDDFFNHMMNGSKGTKMPRGDKSQILRFPLPKIELLIQQKIASVLSSLDSKIELNNLINAELEAMAKTLYDYWFVQFDFPDKNGKPYKSSGGKMVWNEELKREIPEGWEVVKIDNYAEVKKGELITAKDAKDGFVKVVAAGINYSYFHSLPNRLKNTITISGSGANAGFINFWREPIFASDCITVRGKSDTETLILLQYLNFIQPHILSQATGSAQPHVYPSDIKILNYIVPPDLLIEDYGKMIIPMNDKIGSNKTENQKLTELRDWLLPLLMNGQVKVMEGMEE